MPISVSPTVDRLLDIAYDQQGIAFARQHIHQQSLDHLPLQATRILEFIHQYMMVSDACFLQDKIRIAFFQGLAQYTRCFCQQCPVGFG